jgi:hypothetical protein
MTADEMTAIAIAIGFSAFVLCAVAFASLASGA